MRLRWSRALIVSTWSRRRVTGGRLACHGTALASSGPFDHVVVVDTSADGPDVMVDDGAVAMLRRAPRGGTVVTTVQPAGGGSAA